jgi:hypothetical protein
MQDLEERLRRALAERAAGIETYPPLRSADARQVSRAPTRRRILVVAAIVGMVALAAGIALPQALDEPAVTPVSERFVVASGETKAGPWRLTAYRGEVTWFGMQRRLGWCLDLDSPEVEDPDGPHTIYANMCAVEDSDGPPEPIGGHVRIPDFDADRALVYGEVSAEVHSLEIRDGGTGPEDVDVVRPPSQWELPTGYYVIFLSGPGKVELVARGEDGEVLAAERV